MSVTVTETFDVAQQQSTLTLQITGSPDTIVYTFASGIFTLAERTGEATLTRGDAIQAVKAICTWFERLQQRLLTTFTIDENIKFNYHIINNPGGSKSCRLKFGGDEIIDFAYDDVAWEAVFQPRAEQSLMPSEFWRFEKSLKAIAELMMYPAYS